MLLLLLGQRMRALLRLERLLLEMQAGRRCR
jgi:hypothetical protein